MTNYYTVINSILLSYGCVIRDCAIFLRTIAPRDHH
jgi:hypothetical protein